MKKTRKTIGRTFNSPVLNNEPQSDTIQNAVAVDAHQVFILSSGKEASFVKVNIPADEVESSTYVVQEINGRDQTALTPESLKDITRTLTLQQFFPTIGVQTEKGIEILDGSRRRHAAILCKTGLDVLLTSEALTPVEARTLARDIQTAKEHNLREIGMRLMALKNSGLSQKEIAEDEGLSQAKVTRALQAASVSSELLKLFPEQSELTYSDYKILLSAEELLKSKTLSLTDLAENVNEAAALLRQNSSLAADEIKNQIIAEIRKEASLLVQAPSADKTITTSLWQFNDKNRFARKKVRGRVFTYEFGRLPTNVQKAIDNAVLTVLSTHLKEE